MTEDLYEMDGDPGTQRSASEKGDTGDSSEAQALLPKSLMAGKEFKVGDEIVLKIDAIGEDEFTVSYASEKSEKESPKEDKSDPGEGMEDEPPVTNSMYD